MLYEDYVKKKKSYPHNRPWRPIGLWDVQDPTFSRQLCSHITVRLSALRAARIIVFRNYFPASDIHFCYRLNKLYGLVRPKGLDSRRLQILKIRMCN
jgi:hypothetical protein